MQGNSSRLQFHDRDGISREVTREIAAQICCRFGMRDDLLGLVNGIRVVQAIGDQRYHLAYRIELRRAIDANVDRLCGAGRVYDL